MKGDLVKLQVVGFIVIIALVFIFLGSIFNVFIQSNSASTIITAKETKILTSLDTIESVKIGTKYMLNFSFQQAIYDLAKRGGYIHDYYKNLVKRELDEDEYPIWKNYSKNIFINYLKMPSLWYPYPVFEDRLTVSMWNYTTSNVKIYMEDLRSKFGLNATNIATNIYLDKTNNEQKYFLEVFYILNYSEDFFNINDAVIEKIDISYLAPIYIEMVKIGNETFLEIDSIKERIIDAINSVSEDCKSFTFNLCEREYGSIDPEKVLKSRCPNVLIDLEERIVKNIKELEFSNNEYKITIKIDKIVLNYSGDFEIIGSQEDSSCGCKNIGEYKEIEERCNGYEEEFCNNIGFYGGFCNEDGNIVCYNCLTYENNLSLNAKYTFFAAAKVLVDIETNEKYILFEEKEGETKLRPIILRFSIITSSDYTWTPI